MIVSRGEEERTIAKTRMSEGESEYVMRPIGYIRNGLQYRYEAPRQGCYAKAGAFLEFAEPRGKLRDGAEDLEGFERVWLIFVFDRNAEGEWKSKVSPPVRGNKNRYGVFATRSPYRPNRIGMSCVRLLGVTERGLELGPTDLLEGTPVLDIKPYIAEVDAYPEAKGGWRDEAKAEAWAVEFTDGVLERLKWVAEEGHLDLRNAAELQLGTNPFDRKRKRVRCLGEEAKRSEGGERAGKVKWEWRCRTWGLVFGVEEGERRLLVEELRSHYGIDDLEEGRSDPYGDKGLHREYRKRFGENEGKLAERI